MRFNLSPFLDINIYDGYTIDDQSAWFLVCPLSKYRAFHLPILDEWHAKCVPQSVTQNKGKLHHSNRSLACPFLPIIHIVFLLCKGFKPKHLRTHPWPAEQPGDVLCVCVCEFVGPYIHKYMYVMKISKVAGATPKLYHFFFKSY